MGLIDSKKTNFQPLQGLPELLGLQPLRRQVKKFDIPEDAIIKGYLYFIPVHAAVYSYGLYPLFLQVFDLVFHQGDQWGDDQAEPFHCQGRDLETNRFAATRRQKSQGILAIHDRLDDLFLQWPEA
jgi:hypothetical protein